MRTLKHCVSSILFVGDPLEEIAEVEKRGRYAKVTAHLWLKGGKPLNDCIECV